MVSAEHQLELAEVVVTLLHLFLAWMSAMAVEQELRYLWLAEAVEVRETYPSPVVAAHWPLALE